MSRTPLVCGNWKLNHGVAETRKQVRALVKGMADLRGVDVAVAPVATTIFAAAEEAKGSRLGVAGQNVYFAEKGAFTGEWSVAHLAEVGCTYCIVGHSERRHLFNETDEGVAKKVRAVLDGGLTPIACVGETLEEREGGRTMEVVCAETKAILSALTPADIPKLVMAYEPLWAIGTGKVATAAQAQEVHRCIRQWIRERFGADAETVRILYGGSVKPDNAAELIAMPDVDGSLVGGASLQADSLLAIARASS